MGFVPFTAIWKATGCPLRKGGTLVAFYIIRKRTDRNARQIIQK